MPTHSKAAFAFMQKILPCFRPPTANAENADGLIVAYVGVLSGFSDATLSAASDLILHTRTDPFFPTCAECIAACEKVDADVRKAIADKDSADSYARLRIKNGSALAGDYRTLGLPLPGHVVVHPEYPGDPCER